MLFFFYLSGSPIELLISNNVQYVLIFEEEAQLGYSNVRFLFLNNSKNLNLIFKHPSCNIYRVLSDTSENIYISLFCGVAKNENGR